MLEDLRLNIYMFLRRLYVTKPSNRRLVRLFDQVDKIQIRRGGIYDRKHLGEVLLVIDNPTKIKHFQKLLVVNEDSIDGLCCDIGDFTIELKNKKRVIAAFDWFYASQIRYKKWDRDAELINYQLLDKFVEKEGMDTTLNYSIEKSDEDELKLEKWNKDSPSSFQKYIFRELIFESQKDLLDYVFDEFSKEIPSTNNQILALLKSFGSKGELMDVFSSYDELPNEYLNRYDFERIVKVYRNELREREVKFGFARYVLMRNKNELRKENGIHKLLEDLKLFFQNINNYEGIRLIDAALSDIKGNKNVKYRC